MSSVSVPWQEINLDYISKQIKKLYIKANMENNGYIQILFLATIDILITSVISERRLYLVAEMPNRHPKGQVQL